MALGKNPTPTLRLAPEPLSLHEFSDFNEDERYNWRLWVVLLALAILLHLVFFMSHIEWGLPAAPPRVEIQQVDPQKLDQIRKQWREKGILIDKDNQPSAKEAPDNARYMSDKNIKVEKEQRARNTIVVPKPGSPSQAQQAQEKSAPKPKSSAQTRSQTLPKLGNLGIPFHMDQKPVEQENPDNEQQQTRQAQNASQPGGEQSILDKNVPEGSQNLLNSEESIYYSFYARLYQAIGPIWESKLRTVGETTRIQAGDYSTAVDVVLDQEGNLVEVRMLQSSSIPEFDKVVDASWKMVGRFPNPPSGLLNADHQVHTGWTFTVRVGQTTGPQFLPPERSY